jgi:hypothetical protein
LRIDRNDQVWVTDIGNHVVLKCDAGGQVLLTLGQKGEPGDGPDHFNKPTDVAVSDGGDIFVTDGVGVHLGLTPRKYASGEVDYSGGISKCGDPATRSALFEAALCMLTRSKKWSRLKAWGVNLAKRSGFQTACTAVARKLAIVMHRMWLDETEFAYGQPPAALQVA